MTAPAYVEPARTLPAGGRPTLRHTCACGFVSALCFDGPGNAADDTMRVHLALEHGMGAAGYCQRCGRPTDHFRAHIPDLGTDAWLCAPHAPELPVVLDQGASS